MTAINSRHHDPLHIDKIYIILLCSSNAVQPNGKYTVTDRHDELYM